MSGLSFTLLALCLPVLLLAESSDIANMKCAKEFGFHRDPKNCSNFYQCSFGKPADFQFCPYQLVFSNAINNCVPKESQYDDCEGEVKAQNPIPTIEERCKAGEKIIHHPNLCAAYYNCSNSFTIFQNYLEECPYPKLFSLRTFKCEPFERVQCGARKEPKYACDYIKNGCPFAHCRPCWLRFAKCNDKDQYAQIHPWTSKYTKCYKGRSMNTEVCPGGFIFDPIRQQCVDDVWIERSIQNFTCSKEGYYPAENDCAKFYSCGLGFVSLALHCEKGNIYDPKMGSCNSPKDVCTPCGEKIC